MSFHTTRDFSAFGSKYNNNNNNNNKSSLSKMSMNSFDSKPLVKQVEEKKPIALESREEFPALGGSVPVSAKKPTLNFSKTVATMVARVTEEEDKATVATSIAAAKAQRLYHPRTLHIPNYEPDFQQMTYAGDDEEEENGEFNADLVSNRRRGDKGVW